MAAAKRPMPGDHLVRRGEADPEPAGDLHHRAGQDQDPVARQDIAERDVIGDRRAGHGVEGALRHRRLVAHLAEGRHQPVASPLERADIDGERLEVVQRVLQQGVRQGVAGGQLLR